MPIASAAESWVLTLLMWAAYGMQSSIMFSWLEQYYIYTSLASSSANLVLLSLAPEQYEFPQAYFAFTLANFIFTGLFGAEAVMVSGSSSDQTLSNSTGPGNQTDDCCSNHDYPAFHQSWLFNDSSYVSALQGGILAALAVIHLLVVGMGALRIEKSLWSIQHVTAGLSILLCARFVVVFDGLVVPLCPASLSYISLFGIKLMRFPGMFFMFGGIYACLLMSYSMFTQRMPTVVLAIMQVAVDSLFGAAAASSLHNRDILSVQTIISLCLIAGLDLVFMVKSILGLTRRERSQVGCELPSAPTAERKSKKIV